MLGREYKGACGAVAARCQCNGSALSTSCLLRPLEGTVIEMYRRTVKFRRTIFQALGKRSWHKGDIRGGWREKDCA